MKVKNFLCKMSWSCENTKRGLFGVYKDLESTVSPFTISPVFTGNKYCNRVFTVSYEDFRNVAF